jgi:hypothetical protein
MDTNQAICIPYSSCSNPTVRIERENGPFYRYSTIERVDLLHVMMNPEWISEPTDFPVCPPPSSPNPLVEHKHNRKHAHQQTTISDLIDSHRIRRIYKERKRVHGGSHALHNAVWPAAFLHHDCEQPRHHESCLLLGSGFTQPPPPPSYDGGPLCKSTQALANNRGDSRSSR